VNLFGSFEVTEPNSRNRDLEKRGRPKEIKIFPKPDARAYDFGKHHFFYMRIESDEAVRIQIKTIDT
jgi:hypothetical protein